MRLLTLLLGLIPLPALAEDILLSGPPIWESAPLAALAKTQPVGGRHLRLPTLGQPRGIAQVGHGGSAAAGRSFLADGSLSLVGRGATIGTPDDLAGARIALPFNGHLPDLMMRRIRAPASDGWQPHDTGSLVAGMQLLLADQADTALLAEPLATLALAQDPSLSRRADLCALWRTATALADCPPAGVVVANPALGDRPEVLAAYHAAFARLAAAPAAAADLLAGHFPDMAQARAGFARITPIDLPMPENADALAGFFAALAEVEPAAIGGRLPALDFYGE